LGICYGFQLAVIEFARNVCGLKEANSTEIEPNTPNPVIDLMPEQRGVEYKGATMRLGAHKILVEPNTIAYTLYKSSEIYERHRHRFEVNLDYLKTLKEHGLVFSGRALMAEEWKFWNSRTTTSFLPLNFTESSKVALEDLTQNITVS
jgi:CTP synthase